GKNFGIERCERDIIVGEPDVVIRGKKCVSALVKLGIEVVRLFACCHVGQCPSGSYFGKRKWFCIRRRDNREGLVSAEGRGKWCLSAYRFKMPPANLAKQPEATNTDSSSRRQTHQALVNF